MDEVFHEDILETFLFCFTASLGIIQLMAARRGWHGLSLYGGRVRENVNRALGAALLIFSYAWYFSDPLHRNVRNIEALMSMVCLILGILAAAAFSCLAASLSESLLRRRRARLKGKSWKEEGELTEHALHAGTAVIRKCSRDTVAERRLVVLCEPGGLNRGLARSLSASLPEGTEAAFLWTGDFPAAGEGLSLERGPHRAEEEREHARRDGVCELLKEMEERGLFTPRGAVFLGLGWGAVQLLASRRLVEDSFRPASLVLLAPVLPDRRSMTLGDALRSNTASDILRALAAERPWREGGFRSMLRVFLPTCALCALASTALTASLALRWWFLSGPLGGVVASTWATYYLDRLARKRSAGGDREGWERRMAAALSGLQASVGSSPLTVVLVGDQADEVGGNTAADLLPPGAELRVWRDALRGKFLLDRENAERLVSLLFSAAG